MNFATQESAEHILRELYPHAQSIRFVEHGYDNLVGLVDDRFAVRFPRMHSAYLRSQYERLVLSDLASLESIAIPRVLGAGEDPPYLVTSFVRGEHITWREISGFPEVRQKKIGRDIARFAFAMHSLLSVQRAREYRGTWGLDAQAEQPWDVHLDKYLNQHEFPTPDQDSLAKAYYHRWREQAYTTPTVVLHDDLHMENLLFENAELAGILDFGDTNIGRPEQELRQMYRINETVLEAAVAEYERLSGYKLNLEACKIWAIVQALATYAEMIAGHKTDHPGFARAVSDLQRWLPEGGWGAMVKEPKDCYTK